MQASYKVMFDAYTAIFTRFGLKFRAVAADNGAIGGSGSHEFHVIASTGEDALVYCPTSEFAANMEAAEAMPVAASRPAPSQALTKTSTPGTTKCETVASLLKIDLAQTVKTIALTVEKEVDGKQVKQHFMLLLRGDHELNEVKVGKVPGLAAHRFSTEAEILEVYGSVPGYLGPIGTRAPVTIVADRTVANMADFVCGANEEGFHYTGANWGRDVAEPLVADLRNVVEGDASPDGKGVLAIERGIEVGHVFQLGTAYSESMKATFLDENGKPAPLQMGCYGIGVTRILGAAIEQNFDDKGIIWPTSIAPFELVLCPMGMDRSELVKEDRRQALRGPAGGRRGRHRRRPRPASRRHVRRLGVDRRAAPHRGRRARSQGRQSGIPGPPRRRRHRRAARRHACLHQGKAVAVKLDLALDCGRRCACAQRPPWPATRKKKRWPTRCAWPWPAPSRTRVPPRPCSATRRPACASSSGCRPCPSA